MTVAQRLVAVLASAVVVAALAAATPASADVPIGGGAGNPDLIVQTEVAQPWTALQASAEQIVADAHHVPNDAKLLRWARGDIRAVMFFELMAMVNTPADQRTPTQQTDVDILTQLVHDRGVTAAQDARDQYTAWQDDPCDYQGSEGYPYDPGCSPIGGIFQGNPDPPSASAFEAMGYAMAYPELVGPHAIDVTATAVEASAYLSSTVTAAGIATAATLAGVFPNAMVATLQTFQPFVVRGISTLFQTAAETAADVAINAAGAAAWGTVVGVVIEAVAIAVLRGIDVFTAAAIPGTLDQAITDAQQPTDLTTVEADAGGMAEIFTAFDAQTLPDPTVGDTSGAQPGPWNASDATVLVKQSPDDPGTPANTFQTANWDGTTDTVWFDHGYFVVQYPDGHREWTLDLHYKDPYFADPPDGRSWNRTTALVGNELLTPVSQISPYEAQAAQSSPLCPGYPNPPISGCVDLQYLVLLEAGGGTEYVQLVPQRNTNIALTTTPATPVYGQPFILTAQLTTQDGRTPTGSVTFTADGSTLAADVPIPADGTMNVFVNSWHAGAHPVSVGYRSNDDYDSTDTLYTSIAVARAGQLLHAVPIPDTPVNTVDIGPGVTADSGLPVTYSTTSAACRIVDSKIHLVAPGSCVVTAEQAGDTDYWPATTQLSFTVLPAYTGPTVTISTPADGATYAHGALVPAVYSCTSPYTIVLCIGTRPVGTPIDTSTLGPQTFTVTTFDGVLETTKSVTYTVVPGDPATLAATGGSGQSARAGTDYPAPVTATVKDGLGALVPHVRVTFQVAAGSGHFPGGALNWTVFTDAHGIATSPTLTAGTRAGTFRVSAESGPAPPVYFAETVTPAAAATVAATAGGSQSAAARTVFAHRLVATVTDAFGNPVAGAPVVFTVASGSASFPGGRKIARTSTDVNGVATSPTVRAGRTAGPVVITAASGQVAGPNAAAYLETVSARLPHSADLIVAFAAPSTVASGDKISLTATVRNAGPDSSGRYAVAVLVPLGFVVTGSSSRATRYGSTVIFTGTTLAAGHGVTDTVIVRAGTAKGSAVTGAAALAATHDPKYHNNIAAGVVTVT